MENARAGPRTGWASTQLQLSSSRRKVLAGWRDELRPEWWGGAVSCRGDKALEENCSYKGRKLVGEGGKEGMEYAGKGFTPLCLILDPAVRTCLFLCKLG